MAGPKRFSNLDLISQVDRQGPPSPSSPHPLTPPHSFPSASTHPALHAERLSALSLFTHSTYTLGYLLPAVVEALKDPLSGPHWTCAGATVSLAGTTVEERSANIQATLAAWRAAARFRVLGGWRNELYAIYCPPGELYLTMERSACALFGVVTYGVHMTAYTPSPLRIWTPRRNPAKQTYGGLLDNTVAGGIAAGMTALETLVKESGEEASLPEALVRAGAKAVGAVSYFYLRHKSAGGEEGLLQPEVEYCYDLEVGEDVVPAPNDDEVQEFRLWDVDTVREELGKGGFKPNCALVLIDFFIRHGVITPENEPDYIEICSRLHRRLEFPTR